ncbi:diguanylate cyclase [Flavobacterium sp. MXW15]|uniref:diguanylate cyclase n=1 Tax=Xanthomonas chitinilytica TaxID=2989819 RepID=A0ABT3JV68_9XANT|nr:ligand-binding sensor domain-containing diguanylate cyclase [Xanthomonas sp. H13-6]MCW4454997.1 diguanylate cyclase [Flavobacterium sp. MXW15]MCW4472376.1 diguanylate cyclase [Xanthomonas sp. H13-6]
MPYRLLPLHRWLCSCLLGCALLLAGWSGPAAALDPHKAFNHYVRERWSIEQGLPQLSVYAIAQDSDGYLWFGTQGGLARFDGVRMTAYGEAPPARLPGPWIQALLAGRDGELWIGTYKGLALHRNGRFSNLPVKGHPELLDIQALALDSDGQVLVAAQDGVYREHGGELVLHATVAGGAFALLPDAAGLLVGGTGTVLRLDAAGTGRPMPLPAHESAAEVRRLVRAQGTLWAGTSRGLFWLQDGQWRRYTASPVATGAPIDALHADSGGNLWVSQADHLLRIVDRQVAEHVVEGERGLGVRTLLEDRERNLWLGSRYFGVTRLWNGWTRRFSRAEGLADPLAWTVARDPDSGGLWVGTQGGVFLLRDGRYRRVLGAADLPQEDAYALLAEPGRLWVGTRRGALLYEHGRATAPPWMAPLGGLQINAILRDRQQRLWFATSNGAHRWDGRHWRHYGIAEGLRDARVRLVMQARDGRLLLGTQAGLYALDEDQRLVALDQGNAQLAAADISALHELPDGQLLAGTLGEQLWLFDRDRWSAFGEAEGLPTNAPFFLTDDRHGQLWVAGMRGVYRTSLSGLVAAARAPGRRLHGELVLNERGIRHGGIQGPCCNGAGSARGVVDGNTLWLPSRDGVVALDTADILPNPVVPLPRVERVRAQGHWHDTDGDGVLSLPADARDLDFEFTVPSFQAPENVDLRYRLLGYDAEWHGVGDPRRRSATYTNLPAGDYLFQVTGSNNAGHWAEAPAALAFRIAPRFHETAWFHALLVLAALATLAAGWRVMLAWHRRQRNVLERLVRERTEALQGANQKLQEASFTDDLTQLRNRRYLSMHIRRDIAMYRRMPRNLEPDSPGMLFVLIDVDRFKAINDSAGHHAGDAVLQQMAQLLQRQTRESDYVVRWGGEEFLLVLRATPRHQLAATAERLRRAIATHAFDLGGDHDGHVTCSLGLAEFPMIADPEGRIGWEQLLVLADRALYWVKQHGRNGWAAYRPTATATVDEVLDALHGPSAEMTQCGCLQLLHAGNAAPTDSVLPAPG